MRLFNKAIIFSILSVLCLRVFAEEPQIFNKKSSYLFIQSSKSAEIYKNKKKPVGNYSIVLQHVDPWVIYFSDRPKRDMGFMPIEDFLAQMKKQGKKFEPRGLNAAVVSLDKDKEIVSYIFTLSRPQYEPKHSRLIFTAKVVPGKAATIFPPEVVLKHIVIFIDACVGCVGPP